MLGNNGSSMQSSAQVACRQLGFDDGAFRAGPGHPGMGGIAPSWLSRARCKGIEDTISECEGVRFGNTRSCGAAQELVCSSRAGTCLPLRAGDSAGRRQPCARRQTRLGRCVAHHAGPMARLSDAVLQPSATRV